MNFRKCERQPNKIKEDITNVLMFPSPGQRIEYIGNIHNSNERPPDLSRGTIVYIGSSKDCPTGITVAFDNWEHGHDGVFQEYTNGSIRIDSKLASLMRGNNCWWVDELDIQLLI